MVELYVNLAAMLVLVRGTLTVKGFNQNIVS